MKKSTGSALVRSQDNATAQIKKNPWPPGKEIASWLVTAYDEKGREFHYTVVIEE